MLLTKRIDPDQTARLSWSHNVIKLFNLPRHIYSVILTLQVIMSHATHLYFDHPAEPDPEELGLNWATRFTDTKKVFSFMPDNLYENIDTLLSGQKTSISEVCGKNLEKCDELRQRQNVIGMPLLIEFNINYLLKRIVLIVIQDQYHKSNSFMACYSVCKNRYSSFPFTEITEYLRLLNL